MLKSCLKKGRLEAGCDEAGRGCLAGPVYAAAVVFPSDYVHTKLNDSKQLSAVQREKLRFEIEKDALAWAVARVDALEIDEINILAASIKAMNIAVEKLTLHPDFLLIDGNRFHTNTGIPYQCVVKGDATFLSIAAASVLAKTYRDEYMCVLDKEFPVYAWAKNKGYPTKEHREAIQNYGITSYHRKSFTLLPAQLSLPFL